MKKIEQIFKALEVGKPEPDKGIFFEGQIFDAYIFVADIIKKAKTKHSQYPPITLKTFADSHDRFLIIDQKELYHMGASLKDLGKKWFAFSRMDSFVNEILRRVNKGGK